MSNRTGFDSVRLEAVNDSLAMYGESLVGADLIDMTPNRRAKVDRVRAALAEDDELGAVNRSLALHGDELSADDIRGEEAPEPDVDAVNRALAVYGEQI